MTKFNKSELCPKCSSQVEDYRSWSASTSSTNLIKYCTEFPNCSYYKLLPINDFNSAMIKHHYIYKRFPYSIQTTELPSPDFFEKQLRELFSIHKISNFLKWLFSDLSKRNNLYVEVGLPSPYPQSIWTLNKYLFDNYLEDYVIELAKSLDSKEQTDHLRDCLKISKLELNQLIDYKNLLDKCSKELITYLVCAEKFEIIQKLRSITDGVDCPTSWKYISAHLKVNQTRALIKKVLGIINQEQVPVYRKITQGLYLNLCEDYSQLKNRSKSLQEFTNYILRNTTDKHIPFTTTNYSAKSIDDYIAYREIDESLYEYLDTEKTRINTKKNSNKEKINEIQKEIKIQKIDIEKVKAKITGQDGALSRINKLNDFINISPSQRLKRIINSDQKIEYFPDCFFKDVENQLIFLSQQQILTLAIKLNKTHRRKFKILKSALKNINGLS